MAQDKAIATRQVTEYLPDNITKEQAAYLLHSIWPKAPETEVIKAAILCKQYGLNPLMRQIYLIEFGKDWAIVIGIRATRQIAQQALKKRDIRYSYFDGPRVMSEEEQKKIRGKVETAKILAVTYLKDNYGNIYPGYGFWPADKVPYGSDKGNDALNMAFIRSERNALDKLAPGELPDIETADDTYIVADYKQALQDGEKQFTRQVEKDIKELWDEPKKLAEPEPASAQAPPTSGGAGGNPPVVVPQSSRFDWDWVTETLQLINWKEPTAKSWLASQFKAKMLPQLADMLEELPADKLKIFINHITAMRESAGQP